MKTDIRAIAMGCKPDPFKFKIVELAWINGYTAIMANYEGCLSFGGNKLMLLRGEHLEEDFECLDPHFLDENYAVIGRFIPNEIGWDMVRYCALNLPHGNPRTTREQSHEN